MSSGSSRDTLLLQLSVIGDSVTRLRAEVTELGGALIEAERLRLLRKLDAIARTHQELVRAIHPRDVGH